MAETKRKRRIAELAVMAEAIARGYRVSIPFGEDSPYDLVVERNGRLERVQVLVEPELHRFELLDALVHLFDAERGRDPVGDAGYARDAGHARQPGLGCRCSGTGAFMKLTAPTGARLIGITTPAAGVAEVHEMKMEGDTMKMRALAQGLELPAGQTVELKPGGNHLMLMDLKQPVNVGATVPVTLRFVDAKGVASELSLQVPVAAAAPGGAATGGEHQHQHKH